MPKRAGNAKVTIQGIQETPPSDFAPTIKFHSVTSLSRFKLQNTHSHVPGANIDAF
jgi:hypothetical protein